MIHTDGNPTIANWPRDPVPHYDPDERIALAAPRVSVLPRWITDHYGEPEDGNGPDLEDSEGFVVLVEVGAPRYAHRLWYSYHESVKAARKYHREQEYAADWRIAAIIDTAR